jgi:TonB family protein
MFAQLNRSTSTQRRIVAASLALHALFLAWLLHSPEPPLLSLNAVALGHNGRVLSRVYFPSKTPDDSNTSSSDNASQLYRRQRFGHQKIEWKRASKIAKSQTLAKSLPPSAVEDKANDTTLSKLGHGATAGLPYGSLPGGPVYGDEIRPALPIVTADPLVYPWERPNTEGKVVIEITIDERGEIVRKTVLQSMGADIDNKCMAALDSWRFQPATRNGLPIASKQDAVFPFKPRGVSRDWLSLSESPHPAIMEL